MSTDMTHPTPLAPDPTVATLRPAGAAGIAATLLMVAAFAVVPAGSGGSSTAAITARYADGSAGYLRATALETLSLLGTGLLLAGLGAWLARRSALAGHAAVIGGAVLVSCQLAGYGVIATLALGAAARGEAVMALYDLSAVLFVVGSTGLALAAGATAAVALRERSRVLGWCSAVVAAAAVAGSVSFSSDGFTSPHGDLGFLVLLLQVVWTATAGVALLRRN